MDLEKAMEREINRCRECHNAIIRRPGPGYAGYLPPVEDYVTIRFHNGFIAMPAEEFKELSKAKQKKLMKW